MEMTDRIARMNHILANLYNNDFTLNGSQVYQYLIYNEVPHHKFNHNIRETLFQKWISRFKDKNNIQVYNSESWSYFCQFVNGNIDPNCIKMYIPLDYDHLYEGANQIFDFLAESGIQHTSKIGSDVRSDDIVIRLKNESEARLLQRFVDNNKYIKEGMIPTNPFCINQNGVGYAYDGTVSYNYCLADSIAAYINEMKNNGARLENINISTFYNYLDTLKSRPEVLQNFKYVQRGGKAISDAYLAIELLKKSLTTNKIEDYMDFYKKASTVNKEEITKRILEQKSVSINEDKKQLWDEVILTTMKKYYRGYDKEYPERSGFNYLYNFLNGDICGITRTNNLRERVEKNLNLNDVKNIIEQSSVPGRNLNEKADNYIKMTMVNEMIKCSLIRFPSNGQENVQAFMDTGRNSFITNSVGEARVLSYTMNAPMMKNFMNNLGVSNINEYMGRYYTENLNKGRRI